MVEYILILSVLFTIPVELMYYRYQIIRLIEEIV